MENTSFPPGQKQNPPSQSPSSDLPGLPPGTFEYVDTGKKRNWKRILEIIIVVVIVSIPLALSLLREEQSFERTYAVLNPASFVTSPSYSVWSGVVTGMKRVILQETPTPTPTLTPSGTPTVIPTQQPVQDQNPITYPSQTEYQNATTQEETVYPTESQEQESYQSEASLVAPSTQKSVEDQVNETHEKPTATPTITPTVSSPTAACYGKKKNDECSYTTYYGKKIEGECKSSYNNKLFCIDD